MDADVRCLGFLWAQTMMLSLCSPGVALTQLPLASEEDIVLGEPGVVNPGFVFL